MTHLPESPSFIIGITGHMDIPEEDIPANRERIRRVFQWLRCEEGKTGESYPDWWLLIEGSPIDGLGLKGHPITLLTSLAPGADTLAAEVALEEGIAVRAALPFPADLYVQSSTFTGAELTDEAVAKFWQILEQSEEGEGIDHFPVLLKSDLGIEEADRDALFREDLDDAHRRHLRYRAAGEYVSSYSQLLISMHYPDEPGQESSAGSQTIVEISRTGPSSGILPMANHFPWNDAVPVFHLPCRSIKRLPSEAGEREKAIRDEAWAHLSASFLPPLWVDECGKDGNFSPEETVCVDAGVASLKRSALQLAAYDEAAGKPSSAEQLADSESAKLLFGEEREQSIQRLSEEGKGFVRALDTIARERNRSSRLAGDLDRGRHQMIARMAIFTFLAAFFFHCFAHWHLKDKKAPHASKDGPSVHQVTGGHDASDKHETRHEGHSVALADPSGTPYGSKKSLKGLEGYFGKAFLLLCLAAIGGASLSFHRYKSRRGEELRFDARAFSEGLRIQFYWFASGNGCSVAERYMNRQKGELDWIRTAISSMSFPYFRWSENFKKLPQSDRVILLRGVISNWVGVQRRYFAEKAHELHRRMHRHHLLGWGLTWAGIIQVPVFLIAKFAHLQEKSWFFGGGALLLLLVFAVSVAVVGVKKKKGSRIGGHHDGGDVFGVLFGAGFIGFSALVAGILLGIVAMIPSIANWTPGEKDLWVILTGTILVAGAISIAWGEKLLLAEKVRQYQSMGDLFRNAEFHLERRFLEWTSGEPSKDALNQMDPLALIQGTLTDLGEEALDENAEWLVLHRSRPFEPFLAG